MLTIQKSWTVARTINHEISFSTMIPYCRLFVSQQKIHTTNHCTIGQPRSISRVMHITRKWYQGMHTNVEKSQFANAFGSTLWSQLLSESSCEYFTWRIVYPYAGCEVTPIGGKISPSKLEKKCNLFLNIKIKIVHIC